MIRRTATMIVAAARKGAACIMNNPHVPSVANANQSAAYTGSRLVTISTPLRSAEPANSQNKILLVTSPPGPLNIATAAISPAGGPNIRSPSLAMSKRTPARHNPETARAAKSLSPKTA